MNSLQQKTDEELMILIQAHNHLAFSELVAGIVIVFMRYLTVRYLIGLMLKI